MHAYIRTYIHTYIHAYIHTYIHTYIGKNLDQGFSSGVSGAPVQQRNILTGQSRELTFYAGFVGACLVPESGFIRPEVAWWIVNEAERVEKASKTETETATETPPVVADVVAARTSVASDA